MAKHRQDAGQALVVVALSMVVILGFLGLGLDLGYLRSMKRQVQKAADAAAIAAAVELNYCTNNCSALQTAAQNALTENGFASPTLVTHVCNGESSGSTANLTIIVNNPPCYLGSTQADPHYNDANYVEVLVSQVEPLMFAKVFGVKTVTLTARSEAALRGGSTCIFALSPTASGAISLDFFAFVNSPCGVVDESNSNSALSCFLFGGITATQIGVVGNDTTFLCSLHPTPKTHIALPTPADPLANLPAPPGGPPYSCGSGSGSTYNGYNGSTTGLLLNGLATLNPGVYCGGIKLNSGAKVTFTPGTYILTSATSTTGTSYGLTVDVGASATGTGVTFYNTLTAGKSSGPIDFFFDVFSGSGVNFTAPTSGTYEGILFFQDPANTQTATIIGSPHWSTTLEGTYYFPKATVDFAFDGPINYNILDAWAIDFQFLTFADGTTIGTSGFNNNYSSLANGSPVKGTGGVIVE